MFAFARTPFTFLFAALGVHGIVQHLRRDRISGIFMLLLFLTLFASLAVSCVIALRIRRPEMPRPFRCWGYPWTPLFFLAVSGWMMVWAIRGRPVESLLALLTVAAGGLLFYLTRPRAG